MTENTNSPRHTAAVPHGGGNREKAEEALRRATTERLKVTLKRQIEKLNIEIALLVAAELTARNVAPCFRGLPIDDDPWWRDNPEADAILLRADLQWIVSKYPHHTPGWKRAHGIWRPEKFEKTADYLHWDGRRTVSQIATALGLTKDQQIECAWVQSLNIKRWRANLDRRRDAERARIEALVRDKDRRSQEEQDATIERRAKLWLCAELAGWRPQRTADVFHMLTGEALPRNVVAKQLEKLPQSRRTKKK